MSKLHCIVLYKIPEANKNTKKDANSQMPEFFHDFMAFFYTFVSVDINRE